MTAHSLSRRQLIKFGGAGVLGAAGAVMLGAPSATASVPRTIVDDLGPGVVQLSLMSGEVVGDIVYIGTRNLEPQRVIAYHRPSRKVIGMTEIGAGYAIQALAADPTGRYLYIGVLQSSVRARNLWRWDLSDLSKPAENIGDTGDRDVRKLAVAPDGVVYAVGNDGSNRAPALWQYDPATGQTVSLGIPEPTATLSRAVAATATTVFFGAGSILGGGAAAAKACLYAVDRATGTITKMTIPDALAVTPEVRELAIVDDQLVASFSGGGRTPGLAIFDPATLELQATANGSAGIFKQLTGDDKTIYWGNTTGVEFYDRVSGTIAPLEFDGPDLGEIWNVSLEGGTLVVTSAYGFVAEIDLAARTSQVTDLAGAGAPAGAQQTMAMAAGGGYAYIGGTGVIARHNLTTGEVVNMHAPGEAKSMVMVGARLYTGQYSSRGIWTYAPGEDEPRQLCKLPSSFNRPNDICYDESTDTLHVLTHSDTSSLSDVSSYHLPTGTLTSTPMVLMGTPGIGAIVVSDGVVYLGGDKGLVRAWDPVAKQQLWQIEGASSGGVAALAVHGRHLYGIGVGGGFFVIDRTTRTVVHTASHADLAPRQSAMIVSRGRVFVASISHLFKIDPKTFAPTVVLADLQAEPYGFPSINVDEDGRVYLLRGRNLIRVDDSPRRG